MAGVMKLTVGLEDVGTKTVIVGAYAQIVAKRAFGVEAIRDGDPEPILYGVWVELEGHPPKTGAAEAFDEWLRKVTSFELGEGDEEVPEDDEDPTPAESSGSSPVSPPTSE